MPRVGRLGLTLGPKKAIWLGESTTNWRKNHAENNVGYRAFGGFGFSLWW
jgi:hypothetical protein